MYIFFFNDTATTEIYTLSLHDALPICFIKQTNDMTKFLGDSTKQLTVSIDKLKRVEKVFWPDEIQKAHTAVKQTRKALKTLRLIGATPRGLEETLKQIDEKLGKLKEKTHPRTITETRKDLEASRKEIQSLHKKISGAVQKFKTLKADAIRVTRRASKHPEIEKIISEIPAFQDLITKAEVRRAMGDEMQERLKDLGVKLDDPAFADIKKQYIANLHSHLQKGASDMWGKVRLRPEDMDRLLIHAVKQVTGEDVQYAKVKAVSQGKAESGTAPLDIKLDGSASTGPIIAHTWSVNGVAVSDGTIFSEKFQKKRRLHDCS